MPFCSHGEIISRCSLCKKAIEPISIGAAAARSSASEPTRYNCSIAKGDPTGRVDVEEIEGFPMPAQEAVIPYVIDQKLSELENGGIYTIDVWHSSEGTVHILDGQHRFVASCIKGIEINLNWKKYGTRPYAFGWSKTKRHQDVKAAKDMLRIKKTSSQF